MLCGYTNFEIFTSGWRLTLSVVSQKYSSLVQCDYRILFNDTLKFCTLESLFDNLNPLSDNRRWPLDAVSLTSWYWKIRAASSEWGRTKLRWGSTSTTRSLCRWKSWWNTWRAKSRTTMICLRKGERTGCVCGRIVQKSYFSTNFSGYSIRPN